MFSLDERYELYFYRKEEKLIACYFLFLVVLFIVFYFLAFLPYQKKETVVGITKQVKGEIVVYFQMETSIFLKLETKKVTIEKRQYSYQILNTTFLNSKELEVQIRLHLPNIYEKENVPVLLHFYSGETTLLKEIKNKMKGWFL